MTKIKAIRFRNSLFGGRLILQIQHHYTPLDGESRDDWRDAEVEDMLDVANFLGGSISLFNTTSNSATTYVVHKDRTGDEVAEKKFVPKEKS